MHLFVRTVKHPTSAPGFSLVAFVTSRDESILFIWVCSNIVQSSTNLVHVIVGFHDP